MMAKTIKPGTLVRLLESHAWFGYRDGVEEQRKTYTKGTLFRVLDSNYVSPVTDPDLRIPITVNVLRWEIVA
jgi:hypothetical protein